MILIAYFVTYVLADIPWPFTLCSTGPFQVTALSLGAAPVRNKNDTSKMTGLAKAALKMRNADLQVRLNGLHLDTQNVTYNAEYDEGDKTSFSYVSFIPSFAPSGSYVLEFNFKDTSGESVGCAKYEFKL